MLVQFFSYPMLRLVVAINIERVMEDITASYVLPAPDGK